MLSCPTSEYWPEESTQSTSTASVLIVDDDAVAAEELAEALELEGFTCITTSASDEALAILWSHPDIGTVITDFYLRGESMAVGNGLELIERIREMTPARKLDFIVVSGDQDVLADCTISGAGKFLAKPIAPESLCTMVRDGSIAKPDLSTANSEEEAGGSVATLHRMVEIQADAIANLTEALTSARNGRQEAGRRLDRLVSAASIAGRRNDDAGTADVGDLIRYVVGQGYAVKRALGPVQNTQNRPESATITKIDV